MKNRDGLPNNDHWETPEWLYKKLDQEFHFDLDPCPRHQTFDGLAIEWGKSNFINPPYNRKDKPKFIKKAFDEWRKGKTCVLLIPASTDSKQFHELILPYAEIRFLKGRVAFKGVNTKGVYTEKNKGKHASMLVIFRKDALMNETKRYDPASAIETLYAREIAILNATIAEKDAEIERLKGLLKLSPTTQEVLKSKDAKIEFQMVRATAAMRELKQADATIATQAETIARLRGLLENVTDKLSDIWLYCDADYVQNDEEISGIISSSRAELKRPS